MPIRLPSSRISLIWLFRNLHNISQKTKKLTKFITESFEVTVLALTGDTDAANIVEKHYIKKGESLKVMIYIFTLNIW